MYDNKKVVKMRPYQAECKEAIEQSAPGKHLAVLATGLGKTVVFTHLEGMGRTLLLSHRDELVRQPQKYYDESVSFGVEKANEHATDEDIVSASVQSLCQDSRLNRFAPDAFETIIVDEAHHAAAKSYKKIINYFSGAKRVIGFTATPKRGDKVTLSDVFDDIIFSRDIRWGIQNEYLSNIRCIQVKANYSLSEVDTVNGDYSASQLDAVMTKEGIVPIAAKAYVEHCHSKGRHTLIYCVTKNICDLTVKTIRALLPENEKDTIQVVTGDTPAEERTQILQDFSDGKVRAVVNCMVLTEGTDLPICDAILNLRPTCNDSLYQQMAGRGTRLYPDKEYCLLVDVVPSDFDTTTRQLCTAPSLFGIDASLLNHVQKTLLNEKTDLLKQCNEWSGQFADAAARLSLAVKDVDLFLAEREEMIQQNIKNPKTLESRYEYFLDKKNAQTGDIDFGNLIVSVNADLNKKYEIHPTWNEAIYMSDPDVLNNVSLTLSLSSIPSAIKNTSVSNIPLEKALNFIHKYCKTRADYYAYSWNKNMQASWLELPATEKQIDKIVKLYKQYGLKANTPKLNQLSKLGASHLIDLALQVKDANAQKKLLERIANPSKRKKKKSVESEDKPLTVDDVLGTIQNVDPNKQKEVNDYFWKLNTSICKTYERDCLAIQKMRNENQLKLDALREKGVYSVSVDRYAGARKAASAAQLGFASSLEQQIKAQNCKFKGIRPAYLTSRQVTAMIALYLKLKNEPWIHDITFTNFYDVCKNAEQVPTPILVFSVQ